MEKQTQAPQLPQDAVMCCAKQIKVKNWKSLRAKKPQEGDNLYDVLLNNDLVVRNCKFVRKGVVFTQIDSEEQFTFNEINSWKDSEEQNDKSEFQEYRKKVTIKAKLFVKGDEDGMTTPEGFTMLDAMENDKYGIKQPELVPYISTLENQKHIGEFGKHYLCVGIDNERWLITSDILARTYERVSKA